MNEPVRAEYGVQPEPGTGKVARTWAQTWASVGAAARGVPGLVWDFVGNLLEVFLPF